MDEVRLLVSQAQGGDLRAYGEIVRRFQDMAYGYAYSLLGDFHLARDAAQEAFIEAHRCLPKLRKPAAFPGWFRRIVFKRCDRLTRGKRVPTVPLQSAGSLAHEGAGPPEKAERREVRHKVLEAIRSLPDDERTVTTLYYIDGYSQKEVADFLEVPVTTVNNRLHASRERLKGRMVDMVADELKAARPGPGGQKAVMDELTARRAQFREEVAATDREQQEWANWWHERRMEDVRGNAARYGLEPDEELPRMMPERRACETFRDDFTDVPRRWGIPADVQVVLMRELCRELGVTPLALHRWSAEGMPVIRYHPWIAYDAAKVREWVQQHAVRPGERMDREEAREPLLLTLRSLAAADATPAECRHVLRGLEASVASGGGTWPRLDPVWKAEWTAHWAEERAANAAQYGLEEPADTYFGIPEEAMLGPVHEIRDLTRRLRVSPFDVMRWTGEGMPCLRRSPYVRWHIERVAEWLAGRGELPAAEHAPQELDDLDQFVLEAVGSGKETPDDGRDVFTVWFGLM